ncbi:MAG: 1-deoxy-D-xylulose-5-phosphate synthase [Steroidobacteraceae bacterium]|jgi:1-deoxy-D-xylulose-5-phosphate synthase
MIPPHSVAPLTGRLPPADPASAELTLALREVFDAPRDRILWDAGQGRALSSAIGMALAAARLGQSRRVVAVIGDAALSAGMAFEALNHAGALTADLLVILDDRHLSIEEDLGALSNRLVRALSGRLYAHLREGGKRMLSKMPTVRELARRSEEHLKGMVLPGTLFEEMGFNYIGPAHGHDAPALVKTLRNLQQLRGPQLLHVVTGHAAGGEGRKRRSAAKGGRKRGAAISDEAGGSYARMFGQWLCDIAAADERVVAITPGRRAGMAEFARRFPERFFDVALAEQHAVTFAAGLATQGLKPVVAMNSTLLQRGYDQLIHDVALQELPVTFAVATPEASFDLSYLRCIPGLVVMAPADENECRQMLTMASKLDGPAVVRHALDGPGVKPAAPLTTLAVGRAQLRREGGSGLALLVFGAPLAAAVPVAERLDATLVNMRFVKPLDAELVAALAATHQAVVTIEDNALAGGAGSAVGELLAATAQRLPQLHLGLPGRLDEASLRRQIEDWWEAQVQTPQRSAGAA